MKILVVSLIVFVYCIFGIFAQETKESQNTKSETLEEKQIREYRELIEGKRTDSGEEKEKRKTYYLYSHGNTGIADTEYEKGKIQSIKIGLEYRPNPFFGIGLGASNNNLSLTSKDNSSGAILAYLLLTAPIVNRSSTMSDQTVMANRLLLAAFLFQPSNYNYRYNALHLDFNFHLNKDNFFDPYIGIGAIAGICGSSSPCSISGGELKLGTQLNFETFFTFFQVQGQVITIKESGIGSFQSQNKIASIGIGARF